MATEVTSNSLKGAMELTLLARIKQGFVPCAETLSYASRLRHLLGALFKLRKASLETTPGEPPAAALEQLRMIRFIHWSVVDDARGPCLLLAVSFDGPWEPYIRAIADHAGPLLDAIFCHCEGYEGQATTDGYAAFARWIRERQIGCDFIYANDSDLTTDDVRYLKAFERTYAETPRLDEFEKKAANLTVAAPKRATADPRRFGLILGVLATIRDEFGGELPDLSEESKRDLAFFERVVRLLAWDLKPNDPAELAKLPPELQAWIGRLAQMVPAQVPKAEAALDEGALVQGNILNGYADMTHGCLVFVQFGSSAGGRKFLERISDGLTLEGQEPVAGRVTRNLALTFRGLQALGCSPADLARFPKEFREGMAARAGLLGMTGINHPQHWQYPSRNWPEDTGQTIPIEAIDAVVILQKRVLDSSAANAGERAAAATPAPTSPPPDGDDHRWTKAHPLYGAVVDLVASDVDVRLLGVEPLRRWLDPASPYKGREHFGFREGFSQPAPRLAGRDAHSPPPPRDSVALGEILLGYTNERGETAYTAPLFKNGSFLAVTKLEQDVKAFDAYVAANAAQIGDRQPEGFMARLMGRDPEGRSLVNGRADNDFDYSEPAGAKCPFHAHIRRANPRDAGAIPTPRIMRRGFSYGPPRTRDTGEPRGLYFMAYNASLADQYEVIQRWVNGGNSTGVLSAHRDLIAGLSDPPEDPKHLRYVSVLDDGKVSRFPVPATPLVRMRWGTYLFVPSKVGVATLVGKPAAAIATLAPSMGLAPASASPPAGGPSDGEKLLQTLEALGEKGFPAWKRILEDADARPQAAALWAAVRARGGVVRTPYGVLLGSAAGVQLALTSADFSVREYWDRMRQSFGETFLGMDPKPRVSASRRRSDRDAAYEKSVTAGRYDREAATPRAYIQGLGFIDSFVKARDLTAEALGRVPAGADGRATVGLADLGALVIARLANVWFSLPAMALARKGRPADEEKDAGRCPADYNVASQYIFGPQPGPVTQALAVARGHVLQNVGAAHVGAAEKGRCGFTDALLDDRYYAADLDARTRTWNGAVSGFVVPTLGSFQSVMFQWIRGGDLFRLQQWLTDDQDPLARSLRSGKLADADADAEAEADAAKASPLGVAIIAAMSRGAVPANVHRETVCDVEVQGRLPDGSPAPPFTIEAGERVVVGLASAVAEAPGESDLLFGGTYGKTFHGCPGQSLALGTLLGLAVAILKQRDLRDEKIPLVVSFAQHQGSASA